MDELLEVSKTGEQTDAYLLLELRGGRLGTAVAPGQGEDPFNPLMIVPVFSTVRQPTPV
ncbi:MAG: hypothetical protein ACRC1K_18430 [Planctomycetia bacterium]